ncbi:hypothetical protein IP92_05232 [Pseudoduganella flava]|uniref:DUF922 domain-containing protein n=1 Tax=Pseudoduganella flava TaxID=871742 RepID=A0A562PES2_9BURK|nr:hypothetical protein [Pseudoduganella flava]QGZ38835.1 hypothetical protein GO485_07080 [Pseudoduganella flava]TWI42899.1 hypothetical protein IP92_05232 [Pseudoduganella flava]
MWRVPLLPLLILPGCLLAGHAAAARTPFQIRCEDTINKTISVLSAKQNGYTINTQLSYKMLTAMKGVASNNAFVLGLTRTESMVQIGLDGQMLQDPKSGYECIAPQIKVQLTYAPVKIYVGNEFPVGSCGYKEILAHEMRHMQAYMDHLPKVQGTVSTALAKRFEGKPLYAPAGTARSALAFEIDSGWLPYIKAEMAKVEAVQARIDAPAEYARLSRACGGEIQRILVKTRAGR